MAEEICAPYFDCTIVIYILSAPTYHYMLRTADNNLKTYSKTADDTWTGTMKLTIKALSCTEEDPIEFPNVYNSPFCFFDIYGAKATIKYKMRDTF